MNQNNQTNQNQANQYYTQPTVNTQVNYVATPVVNRITKNKFLTFVFSLMPGAVQMYHGLFKKGVSIMVLFFGVIALAALLYLPVLTLILPIIWFYSFFDGVNRMNYSLDELKALKDKYLFDVQFSSTNRFRSLLEKRHMIIGWSIVLIGGYALLNTLVFSNYHFWNTFFEPYVYATLETVFNIVPRIIIPIICLIIGVKLIKGDKEARKEQPQVSEITTIHSEIEK